MITTFSNCFEVKKDTAAKDDQPKERMTEALECDLKKVIIHDETEDKTAFHCIQEDGIALEIEGDVPDFENRFRNTPSSVQLKLAAKHNFYRSGYKLIFTKDSEWSIIEETSVISRGMETLKNVRSSTGTSTVLVLHISCTDSEPTASPSELADSVFGINGDPVNLVSQYNACSYGKKGFVPAQGEHIVNGVVQLNLDITAAGNSMSTIQNKATTAANNLLGTISNYDHVMFCIPPGHTTNSIAYGYVNSSRTVYNDLWATYVSTQMHEIGHNLGMAHSGQGTAEYGDQSCMMGYSYAKDDQPKMCFNAAKSSQLGWYQDRETNISSQSSWTGKLIGISDYGASSSDHHAVLSIAKANSYDIIYLTFNRKEGINSGSVEFGDRVTVVEVKRSSSTTTYAKSLVLSALTTGESYTYPDFGGTGLDLEIMVDDIVIGSGVDYATVTIANGQVTPDVQPPSTPSGLTYSNIKATSVSLQWNASSDNVGVTGYNIYRNGNYMNSVTGTSVNITGLQASTTYTFHVKAKDAAGNISNASNTVSVTTLSDVDHEAPTAPSGLTSYNVTSTSLSLRWNASTDNVGVTGYYVYQNGLLLKSVSETFINITGLTASTTYTFYVKAIDAKGNISLASNTISVKTSPGPDVEPPTAPSGLASYNLASTSVYLRWTASSDNVGVTGYDVYKNGTLITTVTGTSVKVNRLKKSRTYTFYVKAKDAAGNVSKASNTLSVTTPKNSKK